jgi:Leucine-rich repeat (LRR) protein
LKKDAAQIVEESIRKEKRRLDFRGIYLAGEDISALFTPLLNSPSALQRVISIILRDSWIKTLPDTIGCFSALKSLDLGGTPLTELPESIGSLACLEALYLDGTNITKLPEALLKIPSLRKVVVYDNIMFPLRQIKESPQRLVNDSTADLVDLMHDMVVPRIATPKPGMRAENGLPVMQLGNRIIEFELYRHVYIYDDFIFPYHFKIWYL